MRRNVDYLYLMEEVFRKITEDGANNSLNLYLYNRYQRYKNLNILIVGDNEEYISALFAKESILLKFPTFDVDVMTPISANKKLVYLRHHVKKFKYDVVLVFSYKGLSPELRILHEYCLREDKKIILVTHSAEDVLKDQYLCSDFMPIISYNIGSEHENTLIPMTKVLSPIVLLEDNYSFKKHLQDAMNFGFNRIKIANSLRTHSNIYVFYDTDMLPTAEYFKYSFMAAGIGNVSLFDNKNANECTFLLNNDYGLIINLTHYSVDMDSGHEYKYESEYKFVKFLIELCQEKGSRYLELGNSDYLPTTWNLKEIYKVPFIVGKIADELGKDPISALKSTLN